MKYSLFRLIPKSHLEPDGYHTKTVTYYKLEEEISSLDSPEEVMAELMQAKAVVSNDYRNSKFVILPIIEVNWQGEINV